MPSGISTHSACEIFGGVSHCFEPDLVELLEIFVGRLNDAPVPRPRPLPPPLPPVARPDARLAARPPPRPLLLCVVVSNPSEGLAASVWATSSANQGVGGAGVRKALMAASTIVFV